MPSSNERTFALIAVFLAVIVLKPVCLHSQARLSAEEAEKLILERPAAVYPPLAKQMRLQGTVKIEITVSEAGAVTSTKLIGGHPILITAAIDAVKKYTYKVYVVDDKPTQFVTTVDVSFSLGISDTNYQAEQKSNEDYFKREDACRNLLKAHQYAEAEAPCTSLVELAEKLPPERQNERRIGNELAGEALLYETKVAEALSFFQNELAIGEASLTPTDAELGYAYHHVALGYHAMGDMQKAQSYYEKSESTLRKAREHIEGDFFKNQYTKYIHSVLRDYIVLLHQTGQEDAAAKAQKRADAIAEEIPKPR